MGASTRCLFPLSIRGRVVQIETENFADRFGQGERVIAFLAHIFIKKFTFEENFVYMNEEMLGRVDSS